MRNRIRLEKIDTGIPEDYYITGFREFLPIERKSQNLVDAIYVRDAIINGTYQRKTK
jgi:UDP-2,3-diacylglucosamine pyrophosphatase LpxH